MALPAPYAPPWKRLGEDLVVMLAWLLLKFRELSRRNREGSLPLPAFWPRRGAQLFWPLVLAASLGSVLALVQLVPHHANDGAEPSVLPAPLTEDSPAEDSPTRGTAALSPTLELLPAPRSQSSPEGQEEEVPGAPTEQGEPQAVEEADGAVAEGEREADGEEERLRAQLNQGDPDNFLAVIRPDPNNATLLLQLSGDFQALSATSRLGQAERWQARAAAWGYSHLELVDGEERLVGRDAQVGEGMILLEAAGAAGSPSSDGGVEKQNGMFGNRSGRPRGALGSAADARSRHWPGLLGRQRGGPAAGAHRGVHGQPPAAGG